MTTEDDFHRILDANPEDHHTRLVFADWLQDRGDPRAEGYRALGKLRVAPSMRVDGLSPQWTHVGNSSIIDRMSHAKDYYKHALPTDWYNLAVPPRGMRNDEWRQWPSRREGEDALAFAFSELPPERQAELLRDPYGTAEGSQQMSRRVKARRLSRTKR